MPDKFTLDDLKRKLQERQHKLTPQRQEILKIFIAHPGEHLSAEDVHGILRTNSSDIGLATVYRTLELLGELGILLKMEFGDGCSRYEINTTDPNVHHHHHLICLTCGKVTEFDDDLLDELEEDVAEKSGFKVVNHEVKFLGYCKECQEKVADN